MPGFLSTEDRQYVWQYSITVLYNWGTKLKKKKVTGHYLNIPPVET